MPSSRATVRVGIACTDRPFSSTEPARGVSSRAMARSSVDLPHAFAPTITLIRPVGTSNDRSSTTTRSS